MTLYRKILSQSWQVTWQNKYLWFFGIFAGFLMSGNYKTILNAMGGDMSGAALPGMRKAMETGMFGPHIFSNMGFLAKRDPISFFVAIFVLLLVASLFIFLIWLSVVSQVSIVNNSAGYLTNKKNDFSSGVDAGRKNFWPVFGLNILTKVMVYAAFFAIYFPVIMVVYNGGKVVSFLYFLAFIIFLPVAIVVSFIIKYSIVYVVVKGKKFFEALRLGWNLFIENWVVSIEMAAILFFIEFFAGLGAVLAILILAIPFLFLSFIFYKMASIIGLYLMVILALLVFIAIVILTAAVVATFQISSWTGLFVELIGKGATSKIARLADTLLAKTKAK